MTALFLGACSAEEQVLNFTDYRAAFTEAVSQYLQRCGYLAQERAGALKDMRLLAVAPELQTTIDEEVAIGRVRLSTACFAPLATASCDLNDAYATIADCITGGKQYMPQVKPGRLCRLQGECIDGFCDLGAVKKPCGMGVCSSYLNPGTQCGAGIGQCDPRQATCWQGTCRVRGGPGTDCLSDADCDPASTCRTVGADRKCAARQRELPTGSSCDAGQVPDGCKAGDRCLESEPGRLDYTCTTQKQPGGTCLITAQCKVGTVCVGADVATKKEGTCQPQGKVGQNCAAAGSICQLTLYCSKVDGTCKAAGAVGASCEGGIGGQACLVGVCSAAAGATGTCQAPRDVGATCQSADECKSGICDRLNTCATVCAPLR